MKNFRIFQRGGRNQARMQIGGDLVGGSVIVNGKRIIVDGKEITNEAEGVVELRIIGGDGNLTIQTDTEVTVEGDVSGNIDAGMNVTCGNVTGDVEADMNVTCRDIGGNVRADMNVNAGDIQGDAKAGMSITARSVAGRRDSHF